MQPFELDGNGECIHGGDGVTCPPCQKAHRESKPELVKLWTTAARYAGHCTSCNLGIHPGQLISKWGTDSQDPNARTLHKDCKP